VRKFIAAAQKAAELEAIKASPDKAASKRSCKNAENHPQIIPELELPPIEAPKVAGRKVGRPGLLTKAMAEEICIRIASGESLRAICRDDAMPEMATVLRWRLNDTAFSEQYAQAREIQAETFYDELVEIADDGSNDWMTRYSASGMPYEAPNYELIQRSKLRTDVRKWAMSKILTKRYGNKVDTTLTGPNGGPVVFKLERVDQEE
jgi:hypothetical protein